MTRPRGELTTYRARGGHATDWANPTRSTHLNKVVEDDERDDDDEEDWRAVTNDDGGTDDGEHGVHPAPDDLRQEVIHRLDVAREPVHNTTDRCRVEEGHGRSEDVDQHVLVEESGRAHHGRGRDHRVDQHKQSC